MSPPRGTLRPAALPPAKPKSGLKPKRFPKGPPLRPRVTEGHGGCDSAGEGVIRPIPEHMRRTMQEEGARRRKWKELVEQDKSEYIQDPANFTFWQGLDGPQPKHKFRTDFSTEWLALHQPGGDSSTAESAAGSSTAESELSGAVLVEPDRHGQFRHNIIACCT